MRHNNFELNIVGKAEHGGYVHMTHNEHFVIRLVSHSHKPSDVNLHLDGKFVGGFRLNPYQIICLERPPHDTGRFIFLKSGSSEFGQANLHNISAYNLGLVRAVFTQDEERVLQPKAIMRSGGTGLAGYSDQTFGSVSSLKHPVTIADISLRLIEAQEPSIRPLYPVSTPVPPPVSHAL